MMTLIVIASLLLLAGCGDDRPPAPTAHETEQLDEVEAMLNEQSENEEGPAPGGADPSGNSQ